MHNNVRSIIPGVSNWCLRRSFCSAKTVTHDSTIGWIGTGVMGRYMCEHLINGGFKKCVVFNRTKSKMEPLLQKGAVAASSPFEVGQKSDVVFTVVGYPHDVRQVILGSASSKGVLDGMSSVGRKGIICDMSTSEPNLAKEIDQATKVKGCSSVDAPVSGGDVGAREARLSIMIGGSTDAVNVLKPLFELMGKNIKHMGPAGQHTKMVNQIVICSTMIGVVEGLLYSYKSGLDSARVLEAISAGAAGSWSLSNYGPRILNRNFDPGFFVDHFVKDMEIAIAEAKRMNLELPGLKLAFQLYKHLQDLGHGKKGTHALILALEKMNKL